MAKKKSKKARKVERKKLSNASPGQLLEKARSLTAAGNHREAIDILKLAVKKDPANPCIKTSLFRAYAQRAVRLRRKGMLKEADALSAHILSIRPDTKSLSAEDLITVMQASPLPAAVSIYADYAGEAGVIREAEYQIAARLLSDPHWSLLNALPDASPLKRDMCVLRDAWQPMNEGRWEASLEVMRSVSRTSPIAPVRMFCRALACFYAGDEAGMNRALSMIPESFPILSTFGGAGVSPQNIPVLWEGRQVSENEIRSLLTDLKDQMPSGAIGKIRRISEALSPSAPQAAVRQILELITLMGFSGILDEFALRNMAEALLPKAEAAVFMTRYYFLDSQDIFEETADYLDVLDREFEDPWDRRIASSLVLTDAAGRIRKQSCQEDVYSFSAYTLKKLGIVSKDPETGLIEMALHAIELDPENRSSYDLLASLPRSSRKSEQLVEQGLQRMVDRFPDDPEPCLALARLYDEKNAFRRAEQMLEAAMHRAPYDERVRERRVTGLLRVVESNFERKKLHIVEKDLEKAWTLSGKNTKPMVAAKQIRFEMERHAQLPLFGGKIQAVKKDIRPIIEKVLSPMVLFDRLKALALLAAEARPGYGPWDPDTIRQLDAVFHAYRKRTKELNSFQVRRLLAPDKGLIPHGMEPEPILSVFLKRHPGILDLLADEDVFPVLEAMLEADLSRACEKEIRRRSKTAKPPFDGLFVFYSAAIEHILGKTDGNAEMFETIVDAVDARHRELFRAASRRLSAFAQGRLKAALAHFDFGRLRTECTCPACTGRSDGAGFLDPDDFDEDEIGGLSDILDGLGDMPWGEGNPLQSLIANIERLVDDMGCRGAPEKIIRKRRRELFNNFQLRMTLEAFVELLPDAMKPQLSREARILIEA